jgi:hypothetical protein
MGAFHGRMKFWLSLLLAFPAAAPGFAVELPTVNLSLISPVSRDVPLAQRPVIPSNLATPAGLELPGAALSIGEIPALPSTVVSDVAPLTSLAIPETAARINVGAFQNGPTPLASPEAIVRDAANSPAVLASLQGLAQVQEGHAQGELAPRFFDQSKPPVSAATDVDAQAVPDAGPKRPQGVTAVDVNVVHTAADVSRLIPHGPNSNALITQLMDNVGTMAPYTIYSYRDVKGGKFVGIDLSRNPKLVDLLPEQQSHEVRLIKKIMVWNQDLQVLVREDGKTPDLVVGGVVTELKSLIGDKVDMTYLLNKANNQVHEHAERHRLGNGAVVIDLTAEDQVPVDRIAQDIDQWRRMPVGYEIPGSYIGPRHKKQQIALDKIYVFGGTDLKMFVRHQDGSFRLSAPAEIPFGLRGQLQGHKQHQLFLRPGAARPPPPDTELGKAFDQWFLVKELRELVAKRRYKRAYDVWDDFMAGQKQSTIAQVKRQIRDIMPSILKGRRNRGGDSGTRPRGGGYRG